MKLRIRLIISYTMLGITATVILGIFYTRYTIKQYRTETYNNAQFLCSQMLNKFEDSQKMMEQAASFILSDQESLYAIRALSVSMDENPIDQISVNTDKATVRRSINTAYNLENFYRVIVFNQHGVIAASNNKGENLVNTDKKPKELPWMADITNTRGKFVLIGNHEDYWGMKGKPCMVYSVVKEIQGNNLGYIEIQKETESLNQIFSISNQDIDVLAVKADGPPIFISDNLIPEEYMGYLEREYGVFQEKNPVNGRNELIALSASENGDVRILMTKDWKAITDSMPNSFGMTMAITGTFLFFSICFIIINANMLTRPIRELREKMERTQLSNISQKIEISSSDGDIQALTSSYQNLLGRLESSMRKEKKMALLQLQAQFDTLQAQINPHFIYNVLNVISNRGLQNDDEIICGICGNLASILRYSTNTKERYATLKQETDYLRNYIYLLEARFENRLFVDIKIEKQIENEVVPKIILQQLVENSIEHGYGGNADIMEIQVNGYKTPEGWRVEVQDSGEGITTEVYKELQEKIRMIHAKLKMGQENLEMAIGGMGLANSYGRMYLLYQEGVIFDIRNREGADGTAAVIGVEGDK